MFFNQDTRKIVNLNFSARTSDGNIWLKVDYSGLNNQSYKNNISGIYCWNNIIVDQNSNKKIVVINESVWNANVRYMDDELSWEMLGISDSMLAVTVLYDTRDKKYVSGVLPGK